MNVEAPSLAIKQKGKDGKLPIPPILEDKNLETGKAEFDLTVQ